MARPLGIDLPYLRTDMNPLRLGFACIWDRDDRARTWSHTPQRLWEALERRQDLRLEDLPLTLPVLLDTVGRIGALRLLDGKRYSTWTMQPWYARLAHQRLLQQEREHPSIHAVLSIGEHGPTTKPLYIYQDFCFAHGLHLMDHGLVPHGWNALSRSTLERRAASQAATYAQAAGVFTMSAWNARYLRDAGLVPAERIHVVHAGVNVPVASPQPERSVAGRVGEERVIAFVGRDFVRKGGDLVVAAFSRLRSALPFPIRLVLAGPSSWPMDGAVPEGVEFLGNAPFDRVRELLRSADVLVMPSRFEAFGIIIAEALASGTPVVGRNDFAMPEMIEHGVNGMLIEQDSVDELISALRTVLESDRFIEHCVADAERIRSYYAWDRVARDVHSVIARETSR